MCLWRRWGGGGGVRKGPEQQRAAIAVAQPRPPKAVPRRAPASRCRCAPAAAPHTPRSSAWAGLQSCCCRWGGGGGGGGGGRGCAGRGRARPWQRPPQPQPPQPPPTHKSRSPPPTRNDGLGHAPQPLHLPDDLLGPALHLCGGGGGVCACVCVCVCVVVMVVVVEGGGHAGGWGGGGGVRGWGGAGRGRRGGALKGSGGCGAGGTRPARAGCTAGARRAARRWGAGPPSTNNYLKTIKESRPLASLVRASTKKEPPSGSATPGTPVSSARISCAGGGAG